MAKFKIGDRVELVKDRCWAKSGMKGAIVSADGSDYGVKFDKRFDGGHDLDGKCERGYGHWAAREDMKLIQRGFAVGQIYRVEETIHDKDWNGSIFKVSDRKADTIYTKAIRGMSPHYFQSGSIFASNIALLTGPQIGEAIRKYDAEHSETDVREVKRHAKVGEHIKVTYADFPDRYSVGDILRVTNDFENAPYDMWHNKAVNYNKTNFVIRDANYVVLEGYKPEQKEQRKAKVGDIVRVLTENGGPVRAGTIWEVDSIRDDGSLTVHNSTYTDPIRSINSRNYVVLSSGKHVYSAIDIQTAKDFVLRTIYDLAEEDVNVILSHSSGDEEDNSAFSCYILTDKAALSDVEGGVKITGTKEYNSCCSDNDEPNEWVGKAVALCKALHRPLPSYTL